MLTKPSGVLVCVHASSADHGYYTRSGQFNKYAIGICCLSAEHTTLSSKRKDWMSWGQYTCILVICPSRTTCLHCICESLQCDDTITIQQ